MRPDEHRHVGGYLVVARARRVQAAAGARRHLGDPSLDRHVDVLVAVSERKGAVAQLAGHLIERAVQLVAVLGADDLALGEHRRVGARLLDVVGPEAPVEADRVVQTTEGLVLGLGEAGHGASMLRWPRRHPA